MATLMVVVQGVLMVLGGAVVLLKLVAPLTKTKVDDKVLGLFTKLENLLKKIVA